MRARHLVGRVQGMLLNILKSTGQSLKQVIIQNVNSDVKKSCSRGTIFMPFSLKQVRYKNMQILQKRLFS